MNKVFYVYESFDMGGRSYIARNSKAVNNREAVDILNDMYKAIEELIEMFETEVFERYGEPGLSDDDVAEYKQLLKRARGEHE